MNWDNQNKDPWGNNNDATDFDDLVKKFSSILGASNKKQKNSNGGGAGGSNGSSGPQFSAGRILSYAFFFFLIVIASQSFYQTEAAERDVVLRLGKYLKETGPGLNFKIPLVDEKFTEDVSVTRKETINADMLTQDENIVDVSISVQYRISNLKDFILNVKSPEESLRQAAESALRHVVGDNSLDQALTVGRESIGDQVKERIQSYLDLYEAGIVVEIVNVQGTNPPSAVKDAFDDFIAAREDKERYQNEAQRYAFTIVPEARGQAQARIQEAEGYKLEVVANAQGEVDRFNQLLFEYQKAPEVTRDRLYLDALQSVLSSSTKVMIDVEGGNNLLYLPLDKIMEENKKRESISLNRTNLRNDDE